MKSLDYQILMSICFIIIAVKAIAEAFGGLF